jgi:hypothetical protein
MKQASTPTPNRLIGVNPAPSRPRLTISAAHSAER